VLHECTKGSDFALDDRLVVIGCSVVVDDSVPIHCPGIGRLIFDDVQGCVKITCEIGVDGAVSTDRKSTRLNSSHQIISYAVFCLKKKTDDTHRSTLAFALSQ